MVKFLIDTNSYDYLLDNKINIDELKLKGEFYTTIIQISEIRNIKNQDRRKNLIKIFDALSPIKLDVQMGIWLDNILWDDESKWHDSNSETTILLRGNSIKKNNWKDAFIGDVAKKHDLILLTNDLKFIERAKKLNIETKLISELCFQ